MCYGRATLANDAIFHTHAHTHTHTCVCVCIYIYIYIYIYIHFTCVYVCVCVCITYFLSGSQKHHICRCPSLHRRPSARCKHISALRESEHVCICVCMYVYRCPSLHRRPGTECTRISALSLHLARGLRCSVVYFCTNDVVYFCTNGIWSCMCMCVCVCVYVCMYVIIHHYMGIQVPNVSIFLH